MNVNIGEKRTFDDWGLRLLSIVISMPEPKLNQVDIPGADGVIDLTSSLGEIRYRNRELQLNFDVMEGPEGWHTAMSRIGNYLHGQRLKVILDTDPNYYYIGRLSLSSEKSDYYTNHVTITGDMDPYKYELQSSLDDWLWDTLNFDTGIIRDYRDLVVDGSMTIVIPGTRKVIVPTIQSNAAMEVEWQGVRYPVPAGETKMYAIPLVEGDNTLTFYGHGVISIDYRGGIL